MIIPNNVIIGFFVLFAVLYTLSSPFAPYPFSPVFKVFPILLLGLIAWQSLNGRIRTLTLLALLFSGCGDLLLAIRFEQSFVAGLSAFLVAHIFYILLFASQVKEKDIADAKYQHLGAIAMLLYSWFMVQWIMPEQQLLKYAVIVYVAMISFMCITAIFSASQNNIWHLTGALVFALSDSLIAWNAFRHPIPLASLWIMASYYLAQLLILTGILRFTVNAHHAR